MYQPLQVENASPLVSRSEWKTSFAMIGSNFFTVVLEMTGGTHT